MQVFTNQQLPSRLVDWPVHMRRALQLAESIWTARPNPRVGCVIVREGSVVAEGWHKGAGLPHAEVEALAVADPASVTEATVFVTLEPCAHHGRTGPCAEALVEAGVGRVVIAMVDPNPRVAGEGVAILERAGVEVFHLADFEAEARAINPGFCKRMEQGLPLVRLKLAMSLDGRTALANGQSQWITGPQARADVQRLRALSDAIVTGVGSVLEDKPRLNVRPDALELTEQERIAASHGLSNQPLRVVLDSKLRTPGTAALFETPPVLLFAAHSAIESAAGYSAAAELVASPQGESGIDLGFVLESLAQRDCNELLVECGPTLAAGFLAASAVDELIVYVAPRLLGSDAKPLLALNGLTRLSESLDFQLQDVTQLGPDLRLSLRPA